MFVPNLSALASPQNPTDPRAINMASPARYPRVDTLRFLSAVAIVWLHCCADGFLDHTTFITRFAVPFFSASAMFLLYRSIAKSPGQKRWGHFAISRTRRLYL